MDNLDHSIATICSHSALQIFHGGNKEGFHTIGITTKERIDLYSSFEYGAPDEFLVLEKWSDILNDKYQKKLIEKNAILVPHGSFVAYIGAENVLDMRTLIFGNNKSLKWEASRKKERHWLKKAGINVPKKFEDPEEIEQLSLVKFPGAKGGEEYFLVKSSEEFYEKIGERSEFTIQEYIKGNRYYPHYFYSPIKERLEILGIDRRDEANVDESFRFSTREKTFVVVGNRPLVVRESLLPKIYQMGKDLVRTSKKLFNGGIFGPFCIESVIKDDLEIVAFEISGRIVAGTNLFPHGSPYSYYYFDKPVSTGRRIAMEIKWGEKEHRINDITT